MYHAMIQLVAIQFASPTMMGLATMYIATVKLILASITASGISFKENSAVQQQGLMLLKCFFPIGPQGDQNGFFCSFYLPSLNVKL